MMPEVLVALGLNIQAELGAAIFVGALTRAVVSGTAQVVTNLLTGQDWKAGLGSAILGGAILGGVAGGVGYLISKAAISLTNRNAKQFYVETPYGPAQQNYSFPALKLRYDVQSGKQIFRGGVLGKSNAAEGQFWAPEIPLNPGFASRYGVASFTQPDFILSGSIRPGANFITRPAPAVGGNSGGALEIVTEIGGVVIDFFHMP